VRTDQRFVAEYRAALASTTPAANEMDREEIRALATTELCLHFVAEHLPKEDVSCVPYLMLGYPRIVENLSDADIHKLATLRHLGTRYISVSAWLDACRQHGDLAETLRVYDIIDRRPLLRKAASPTLHRFLTESLNQKVPWVRRRLSVAGPGDAVVAVDRGQTLLSYRIPHVAAGAAPTPKKYDLSPRAHNPPILVTLEQMRSAARRVDEREAREDWPRSLPRLKLEERFTRLQIKGLTSGFLKNGTMTLDGAVHLVGMLSSGKSTLVWALIFVLTQVDFRKRIAMLVTDTIQAATVVSRLRLHGIKASVLSSLYNRDRHLSSIHWQQGIMSNGWSLSSMGDIAQGFSVACSLDGMQPEPRIIRGSQESAEFPSFKEKPCHRLYLKTYPQDGSIPGDLPDKNDDIDDEKSHSCPLWACCPAQEQQRSAVDAEVLVMTAQAFVHMTPDKWVSEDNITIPELVQFTRDLVILDEVDGMQKAMDEIFAPRSPIMGDELSVYAPAIGSRSSEALRKRSGIQFRREVNTKWQANFHAFFRLIGVIYALLQNEESFLRPFYKNKPFTAASILYDLWRRRTGKPGAGQVTPLQDREIELEFLEVMKLASAISRFSRVSSIAEEETESDRDEPQTFQDPQFQKAAEALQGVAREILVADYYRDVASNLEAMLGAELSIFRAAAQSNDKTSQNVIAPRANALALLLAVVTELALSHYNWLIKTQPAVATAFGIDDAQLLSQANNLIRHYRTLLPWNPAGAIFGFFYDAPTPERERSMGGKLTLINHLGVGRYLIAHLHDLLAAEGQAGPHVLMLSGTSWAGGSVRRRNPKTGKPIDAASPSFDVQVPVKAVLLQPDGELTAIKKSVFSLVHVLDEHGKQVRISGSSSESERRKTLAFIAQRLVAKRDETNLIEENWRRMEAKWGGDDIEDRRRALLVVNSYADARVVADALLENLEAYGYSDWHVRCLIRDHGDDDMPPDAPPRRRVRELPRSLVETFGEMPEKSLLVAPMVVVARGHNILNPHSKAAISSIYFLHRPHPRPEDLAPIIGRLNRFALERFDKGLKSVPGRPNLPLSVRARRMRHAATKIVRLSLDLRSGYAGLPAEYKAQFAWDMLTPLWQTIGRGIRNGCPVWVGFVDRQFAPGSFDGQQDTGDSSVLVQAIEQLGEAMDRRTNQVEHEVARLLYEPFHDALSQTKGLNYGRR
jgi:hypothetical protein